MSELKNQISQFIDTNAKNISRYFFGNPCQARSQ